MKPVPHGELYAGKLHVRFDEGAGVPDEGRPALLYTPETLAKRPFPALQPAKVRLSPNPVPRILAAPEQVCFGASRRADFLIYYLAKHVICCN